MRVSIAFDFLFLASVASIAYGLYEFYSPSVYWFLGAVGLWVSFKGTARTGKNK